MHLYPAKNVNHKIIIAYWAVSVILATMLIYRVGQKSGLFWRLYNFAMVNGRNLCDMSKVTEFCLEKV